jgi:hypothetical protein
MNIPYISYQLLKSNFYINYIIYNFIKLKMSLRCTQVNSFSKASRGDIFNLNRNAVTPGPGRYKSESKYTNVSTK